MACGTVFRSVFMTEAWRPFHQNRASALLPLTLLNAPLKPKWSFRVGVTIRDLHRRRGGPFNCFNDETLSSSSQDDQAPPQEAVLKAISEVSKTEGRIGQTTNVVIGGTITDDSTNKWLALDQKVNSYPTVRGFTAIGTGCDDFVQAMVVAIESVLQYPIPEVSGAGCGWCGLTNNCCMWTSHPFLLMSIDSLGRRSGLGVPSDGPGLPNKGCVKQKLSSRGKYVSVNIGPVQVVSSEQVQAVYNAMRRDDRMKYFL